jgi:hypothetical protein
MGSGRLVERQRDVGTRSRLNSFFGFDFVELKCLCLFFWEVACLVYLFKILNLLS